MASGQKHVVLEWPSYSTDLNLIENIWGHMEQQLYQKAITDVKKKCGILWHAISYKLISQVCQLKSTARIYKQGGKIYH